MSDFNAADSQRTTVAADDMHTAQLPRPSIDLKELSHILGLSIGTVSRSLNNHPSVNHNTKVRVQEAARKHGYRSNSAARLLKVGTALTVGVFFAPYRSPNGEINPAALNIIEALRQFLPRHGMDLQVFYYSNDDELREQGQSINVGLFIGHFAQSSYRIIHDLGIPAIVYNTRSPYPTQVSMLSDDVYAGATAVQYLSALGHRAIGLVTGPLERIPFAHYRNGFEQAAIEFDIPLNPEWLFELPANQCNKDSVAEILLPLLKMKKSLRPTAIVFASDWYALGGRKAAKDAGLCVPEDLSLIGHDNLAVGAESDPPLTTFDIHLASLAQTITTLATKLSLHNDRELPVNSREVLIRPDLIKRGSCASLWPKVQQPGSKKR